ncbi:MAG: DUF58 domain-containing protein [Dermatophilaceae bacterium]|nr:DUF58 domain-containing protein [Actinomycetales bacterium]MBP9918905.1 DUF58 domain-containing protein [Dermatophilaceae bacterium]
MAVSGRFALLILAGAVPVAFEPTRRTVLLWVLMCCAVAAIDAFLAASPRRLVITREPLGAIRLGEATRSSLLVTNPTKRRLRGQLRDAWQPSAGAVSDRHTLAIPPGERRRITTSLRPTRRGDRWADRVTIRAFGPLRLGARQRSLEIDGVVRALPPFESRKHLPSRLASLRQIDGRSAVRTRGQGTEFDSLRDYVDGDDVRSIDWRATARRRNVVVRTWQPERDRRVVLVLDTSRTSAARIGDMPRLDAAMDAALLLAALASRAGDRVDLLAGDRWVRARVSASANRTTLLNDLVEAMAPLDPALLEASWPTLATAIADITRRRALVVLLTPLDPAAIRESMLPTLVSLTRHHRVVIASVTDPALAAMAATRETTADAYAAAAAERTAYLQDRTAEMVGRLGVDVVTGSPEELPPRLADHYLMLKAAGLL